MNIGVLEGQQMLNLGNYTSIGNATVDGAEWNSVQCNKEVAKWVRRQNQDYWYEHINHQGYLHVNIFDMHNKLYTLLKLTFTP